MVFRVVSTKTVVKEELIDASSIDEAREKWEQVGYDAELFYIEGENGELVIYND